MSDNLPAIEQPEPQRLELAAVAVDEYKLPVFERRLKEKGYHYDIAGEWKPGILLLGIQTTNLLALDEVLAAANAEATGRKPAVNAEGQSARVLTEVERVEPRQ